MTHLRIRLLGPFQVTLKGQVITSFETEKARALLAYLAAEAEQPHRREALAEMLWPHRPEGAARANLRHTLAGLRQAIGNREATSPYLLTTRDSVQFNLDSDAWVDVGAFRRAAGSPGRASERDTGQLEKAAELIRGAFLEDVQVADSAAFEEWALLTRRQLGRQMLSVLSFLTRHYQGLGDHTRALELAWRQVELAPWDEGAHQQMMCSLALTGKRSAALAQYEACCHALDEELDVEPSPDTLRLYEQIRDGTLSPPPGHIQQSRDLSHKRHNLPAALTPLIGRSAELAQLEDLLRDPTFRLVTLIGPGGSGKTRLALEWARQKVGAFRDGAYFVALAPLQTTEAIVPAVAGAIGLSLQGQQDPQQQLLSALSSKEMLLVLDNYEHLLEGADLVLEILERAPGVRIVTTSRASLNVRDESVITIGGMGLPAQVPETPRDAMAYGAIGLYVACSRRSQPDFELTTGNMEHVVRIGHLVAGMPLALVLAAAWVDVLTSAEIAARLSKPMGQGLDLLESDWSDVPERQRSMRAAFDHSWRLLNERDRETLQALSVFRGGFTSPAAQDVAGATLRDLRSLMRRSVVHRTAELRYEMHELLRQYASEKLWASPAAAEEACARHCDHFLTTLRRFSADTKGSQGDAALAEMDSEIANARAAWDWAVLQGEVRQLDEGLEGLGRFYWFRGRFLEGESACRIAAEKLSQIVSAGGPEQRVEETSLAESLRVWARALMWQGQFNALLGCGEMADRLLRQSLTILEGAELADRDTRAERAYVLLNQARRAALSDLGEALRLGRESLSLFQEVGERWHAACALDLLQETSWYLGAYEETREYFEECAAILRSLGQWGPEAASQFRCLVALAQGRFEEAERISVPIDLTEEQCGGRYFYPIWLYEIGMVLCLQGNFGEAQARLERGVSVSDEMGLRLYSVRTSAWLGLAKMHLGMYEGARLQGETALGLAREDNMQWGIGFSLLVLGTSALSEQAYARASALCQEGAALAREAGLRHELGWASVSLAYAARGLGRPGEARGLLREGMRTAVEGHRFVAFMYALAVAALLLLDAGETERAVELYALASRYGFVANSRWFEDVFGREIAAAAETLPPDVVAAAQERGRARDLWETARELLAELESEAD